MRATDAVKTLRSLHEAEVETGNMREARAIEMAIPLIEKERERRTALGALLRACEASLPFYETCDDPAALRVARQLRYAVALGRKSSQRRAESAPPPEICRACSERVWAHAAPFWVVLDGFRHRVNKGCRIALCGARLVGGKLERTAVMA